MLSFEIYFLWALALVWVIFATVEDIKTREIANWLNFSLLIFALGFRFFYSFFELGNMSFFYQGLLGAGIFIVLSNLFYYGKMFAGGDQKLMASLGAILPIYSSFYLNLRLFLVFLFVFLVVGAIYGILVSFYFGIKNSKRLKIELRKQFSLNYSLVNLLLIFSGFLFLSSFFVDTLIYLAIFVFVMPYLYLCVKSIDEVCMVKNIRTSRLTEGDWLYEDVKVGNKTIKATWDGLTKEDIRLLKKKEKVWIRQGIQFAPTFLISFILMFIILKFNLFGF